MALCPAHDDHNPSLAISEKNGKVLVHCHAGCSQRDVLDALKHRSIEINAPEQKRVITVTYDYTDENAKLLYQVVRYEPKHFSLRRPGHGGWIDSVRGVRRVLYHLPEILKAEIVFITEGEKDADALRDHGFVATTNAGGAKSPWLDAYTESLRGKKVIIVPDNDDAGRKRTDTIGIALQGHVAEIIILDDIHADGAKDIAEWFERGHSEIELISFLEALDGTQV
jgi:putative DNA primase/helicase